MSKNHIISIIESAPLASLSESDLNAIRGHTADCVDCRRAFEAAQISALLLKEGAAEVFEPSPFFHTRVMATLRERQAEDSWALGRVWRAAGALASSMVATVAALAVLTFVIPGNQVASNPQDVSSPPTSYSAEEVLIYPSETAVNQGAGEQVSDGQILGTLYGEEEAVR